MGMSTHIQGIGKPDAKHKKMFDAYEACKAAGIDVPDEVNEYFDWDTPNEMGRTIELRRGDSVTEYKAEMRDGYDVEIAKLPKDITHIRFFNSY